MKKIFFLVLIFNIANINAKAQNYRVDIESIFKMQLFLDKKIDSYVNVLKNDSLYFEYSKSFYFNKEIKALKSNNINNNYHFYSFDMRNDIILKYPISFYKENLFFDMKLGATRFYILCVNIISAKSYKISGFDGNDFFSFLEDYIQEENISVKDFLKKCKVENIDFKCLYNGLKAKKRNTYKYPCLKRVSEPMVIGR